MRHLLTSVLLVLTLAVYGQKKPLSQSVEHLDFLIIEISHLTKSIVGSEVNVFYLENDQLKVHSILTMQLLAETGIDTSYVLNEKQLATLDAFGYDFDSNRLRGRKNRTGFIPGTWTEYSVTLKGQRKVQGYEDGSYSLAQGLLED